METAYLPTEIRYFHPACGFFASLKGTYVNQKAHLAEQKPDFAVVFIWFISNWLPLAQAIWPSQLREQDVCSIQISVTGIGITKWMKTAPPILYPNVWSLGALRLIFNVYLSGEKQCPISRILSKAATDGKFWVTTFVLLSPLAKMVRLFPTYITELKPMPRRCKVLTRWITWI